MQKSKSTDSSTDDEERTKNPTISPHIKLADEVQPTDADI
jgi:hypothetical protein